MRYLVDNKDPLAAMFNMSRLIKAAESGSDPVLRGAPALVVAHGPKTYGGAIIDSTIALTTLELAAFSFGLGTCWAGFFQIAAAGWGPLQDILNFPAGHVNFGSMVIGYPKFMHHRIPLRNEAAITWLV